MFLKLPQVRSSSLINPPCASIYTSLEHRVELITPSYLPTRNLHFVPLATRCSASRASSFCCCRVAQPCDRQGNQGESFLLFNPAIAPWGCTEHALSAKVLRFWLLQVSSCLTAEGHLGLRRRSARSRRTRDCRRRAPLSKE